MFSLVQISSSLGLPKHSDPQLGRTRLSRRVPTSTLSSSSPSLTSLHANMPSLLCRSALQLHSYFFTPTTLAVAVTGRAHYSSAANSEWAPTHQYASKANETHARRKATDPEYRGKSLALQRAWRDRNAETRLAYARAYKAQHYDGIQAKSNARRSALDYDQLYYAKQRARYASDDHYKQRESLRTWVLRTPWVQDLTWQTHRPIVSEKIVRYCGGCEVTRSRKLWWQDSKTDEFLCHPCFTSDWSRALPIGYEGKVFGLRKYKSKSKKTTTGSEPGPDA
jgi:hypothetical protein